jgi:type I restriction enzyme S subunit
MRSPFYYQATRNEMYGVAITRVTLEKIKNAVFPLPPLQEQEQIVAKLEELMAFCDGLEQSIKESQGYNEILLQQVLREALQPKEEIN